MCFAVCVETGREEELKSVKSLSSRKDRRKKKCDFFSQSKQLYFTFQNHLCSFCNNQRRKHLIKIITFNGSQIAKHRGHLPSHLS